MAWSTTTVVVLIFLAFDLSGADNDPDNGLQSIAVELKQLNQKLCDLELRDQQQTEKYINLENELGSFMRLNSGQEKQHAEKSAKFENELESVKRLNSELKRQQVKYEGIIRGLEAKVDELMQKEMENSMDEVNHVSADNDAPSTGDRKDNDDPSTGDQALIDNIVNPRGHGNGIRIGEATVAETPTHRSRRLEGDFQKVAFSATITPHDYGPMGANQIVQFDKVITNVGTGYHAHSGIFTAPVGGVYVFHVTIAGWHQAVDHHYLHVMLNGDHQVWIYMSDYDQSSQLLTLNLNQGDEVYIMNAPVSDVILGATYSTFSGFLLYPSDSGVIVGK